MNGARFDPPPGTAAFTTYGQVCRVAMAFDRLAAAQLHAEDIDPAESSAARERPTPLERRPRRGAEVRRSSGATRLDQEEGCRSLRGSL